MRTLKISGRHWDRPLLNGSYRFCAAWILSVTGCWQGWGTPKRNAWGHRLCQAIWANCSAGSGVRSRKVASKEAWKRRAGMQWSGGGERVRYGSKLSAQSEQESGSHRLGNRQIQFPLSFCGLEGQKMHLTFCWIAGPNFPSCLGRAKGFAPSYVTSQSRCSPKS